MFFFFKQKTAYEMRISDGSSDVCSSDLTRGVSPAGQASDRLPRRTERPASRQQHRRALGFAGFEQAMRLGNIFQPEGPADARRDRAAGEHREHAVDQDRKSTRLNSSH